MSFDSRLYALAEERGWKLPSTMNQFPAHSWNAYWAAMEAYEKDPSEGRPVPPHVSGRGRSFSDDPQLSGN